MNQVTVPARLLEPDLCVDVVVIGAGMGGLTVAASAASAGLSVAVIEVSAEAGGSAALSEGYVWTAPSRDVFIHQDPEGDVEKFELMLSSLPEAFDWVRSLNVHVGPELTEVLGYGVGRQIDVGGFIRRALAAIDRDDNVILFKSHVASVVTTHGAVTGVTVIDDDGHTGRIAARSVVVATGGFQASEEARRELMFTGAESLTLRSNVTSRGEGIALARSVGASLDGPPDGFYGHLIPYPMAGFNPSDYASLAQYFSDHGILLGPNGQRFTDESRGDHVNAEEVAHRGRALLVIDERIRVEQVVRPFIPGMESIDKMASAGDRGANYATGNTLAELLNRTREWGYDGDVAMLTINTFNAALVSGKAVEPPRASLRHTVAEPPFAALEVQSAITFTYRGLATDKYGRVLSDGSPIPGLYAAGVDAGALNVRGYTGGLVRGLALGRQTARTIAADLTRHRHDHRSASANG